MNKTVRLSLTAAIAGCLVLAPMQGWTKYDQISYAATNEMKAFSGMNVKTFKLTSKSTLKVKDVMFQYGASTKRVFFTAEYYNGDGSTIDAADYWVQLNSKNGANYKLLSSPSNPTDLKIAPKTSKKFTYYADVDTSLKYTDIKFKVVKWDFSAPNYTKVIGETTIASTYVNKVPANQFYLIQTKGEKIKSSLKGSNKIDIGNYNEVQIKLNLTNQSNMAVPTDYKYYLRTKSGLVITVNPTDPTIKQVGVNESVDLLLVSQLSKKIDLAGAELLVTKIDGKDSLEVPVANYAVTWNATSTLIAKQNKSSKFIVEDSTVEMYIKDIYTNKGNATNDIVLNMKLVNRGNQEVKLPEFTYEIKTSNGKVYKTTSPEKDLVLLPDKEIDISISTEIPANASDKLVLLISQPKLEAGPPKHLKSAFLLDAIKPAVELNTKIYTSSQGTYKFNIDSIERLPWGDEDIINVYLQVANIGKDTAIIPKLAGSMSLNGIEVKDAKTSWTKLDSQIMIDPNKTANFVVSMKVPYTYTFSKVNLKVLDQITADKAQTIANFTSAKLKPVSKINVGGTHFISSIGRQSEVKIDRVYKFEGSKSNLVYVDLNMNNAETRAKLLPVIKAHFNTGTHGVYDAKIVDVTTKINARENAVVTLVAELPKSIENYNDIDLVIGEAMTNGAYATASKDADGFINVVGFDLKQTESAISKDLRNIELPSYSLDIRSVDARISGGDKLELGLNYTLLDNFKYANNDRERKVIFEIKTPTASFEQTVKLGTGGMTEGNLQTFGIDFAGDRIGSHTVSGFNLNVYEEYEGFRRLVGTGKINGYSMN
ncbi:hypothetical protein I6N90_22675 [Paenibacillus sp. GSMTC-2017]|uniref:hypothetical protein n=1 Tax=Paenibacillus sp. GSMTC-2017 TaxID=2794350 RepID=UPI0018D9A330|nr:hypothetical protein [Paenibacillus sp. GSMTC-2017]MBH5320603.1 hypothetical protein [Paenibacillus sp. GSMTC-2017]